MFDLKWRTPAAIKARSHLQQAAFNQPASLRVALQNSRCFRGFVKNEQFYIQDDISVLNSVLNFFAGNLSIDCLLRSFSGWTHLKRIDRNFAGQPLTELDMPDTHEYFQ